MKKTFSLILLTISFLIPTLSQAFDIVGIDSVNVTAEYTEPTANENGSPLTDLGAVEIWFDTGTGPILGLSEPAFTATGGAFKSVLVPVPIAAGQEADVKFWALAVDKTGNKSLPGPIVTKRLDRLAPAAVQ